MSVEQDVVQREVQQNVIKFTEMLAKHVTNWNLLLQEASKPVQALVNKAEQLRHVEK